MKYNQILLRKLDRMKADLKKLNPCSLEYYRLLDKASKLRKLIKNTAR